VSWQNAETEKPDVDSIVLIHCPESSESVWIGYWDDENGSWYNEGGMAIQVDHWMELPEPPSAD